MKALNQAEITNKYLIFLGYFTLLLTVTLLCAHFYHITCESYLRAINTKKREIEFTISQRNNLSNKIDSLNTFLKLLNTGQVENEVALERQIIKLKNEAAKKVTELEQNNNIQYGLYKKLILSVEVALENKKNYQQARTDEETQRKKLLECIEANKKVKKAFSN